MSKVQQPRKAKDKESLVVQRTKEYPYRHMYKIKTLNLLLIMLLGQTDFMPKRARMLTSVFAKKIFKLQI